MYLNYSRDISNTAGINHLKSVHTKQGHINKFKNLRRKLQSCSANIYFNQESLWNNLTPVYAKIKVPKTQPASKHKQKSRKIEN